MAELRARLAEARAGAGGEAERARIFAGYAYRMHDLSEFMKTLLQRFSSWFNRSHQRSGRGFVEEVFRGCRQYFGMKRKTGARKPRGALGEMAGEVWSARDLRAGVGRAT